VISSVKKLPEVAGNIGKPLSISALQFKECAGKSENDAACATAKRGLTASPVSPDGSNVGMQYDVMIPGGKAIGGMIPATAQYNQAH
jgi:hypothetical protein